MHKRHDLCKGRRCFAWFRQGSSCRHPQGLHGVPRSLSSMAKGLSRKTEKAMSRNHPLLLFYFFTFLLLRIRFTFLLFYFLPYKSVFLLFYLFTFLLLRVRFTFLLFYFLLFKKTRLLCITNKASFKRKQGFFGVQRSLV